MTHHSDYNINTYFSKGNNSNNKISSLSLYGNPKHTQSNHRTKYPISSSYITQNNNEIIIAIDSKKHINESLKDTNVIFLAFFTPSADISDKGNSWLAYTGYYLNLITAWWTGGNKDDTATTTGNTIIGCETKQYSHVELILPTTGKSYSIRWGEEVHAERRNYKRNEECYGFIEINSLTDEQYKRIETECNFAMQQKLKFNYIGNFINFLLPSFILNLCFTNGGYGSENRTFCSEFIFDILQKAAVLDKDKCHNPSLISPNGLWKFIFKSIEDEKLDMETVGTTSIYIITKEIDKYT